MFHFADVRVFTERVADSHCLRPVLQWPPLANLALCHNDRVRLLVFCSLFWACAGVVLFAACVRLKNQTQLTAALTYSAAASRAGVVPADCCCLSQPTKRH